MMVLMPMIVAARMMMVAVLVSVSFAYMRHKRQSSGDVIGDNLHRVVATGPNDRFNPESFEIGNGAGANPAYENSGNSFARQNHRDDSAPPMSGHVHRITLADLVGRIIDVHDLEFPRLSKVFIKATALGHWHGNSHG